MLRHLISSAVALCVAAALAGCGGQSGTSNAATASAAASSMAPAASSSAEPNPAAPQGSLHLFATEAQAHGVCPSDEVVWLNPSTGVYHEKNTRFYGKTKRGNYVCRKAADLAGDRNSKGG